MRDFSKVYKFGIIMSSAGVIISSVAVILSAIYTLYNFIKGTPVSSVGLISCITILFSNIAVAQLYKKKKANKS